MRFLAFTVLKFDERARFKVHNFLHSIFDEGFTVVVVSVAGALISNE